MRARHPREQSISQKGQAPPRPTALKLQSLGKVKKWYGPDPQDTTQTNRPGRNAIAKVHQMTRAKKVIN